MKKIILTTRIWSILCLTFISFCLFAQSVGKISGKVVDAKRESLTDASVIIKGSNKGVSTDRNGIFTLENIANGNYKVAISFVGYVTKEFTVTVPQSNPLNISLDEVCKQFSWRNCQYGLFKRYFSELN